MSASAIHFPLCVFPFLGELSALLTAILWSGSAMVFGVATLRLGSVLVNVARLVLAAVYLGLLIAVTGLDVHLTLPQYGNLALSGIIGLALGDTFLFKAFQEIGVRVSMLIMSLAPAVAGLLAYLFLGETLTIAGVMGIVLTIGGVSAVVLERNEGGAGRFPVTLLGVAYGFLGAAGQGVGLVFAKKAFMEGELNGFVAAAVRIGASLLLLLPAAFLAKRIPSSPGSIMRDRKAFLCLVAGSVLGPFLGISFSLIAVEYAKVGIAATLMATVPIIMLPLARFVSKELLSWKAVAGAFIAVAGVALLFLK